MNASLNPVQPDDIALVLGGGGARSAYQVGVLRSLARHHPECALPILTGVSAGAINAAHLANATGTLTERVDDLTGLWRSLEFEGVFETKGSPLLWQVIQAGWRLTLGRGRAPRRLGMLDTRPLRETLMRGLGTVDGELPGISKNLAAGVLKAVALTATRYATGQTTTFFAGADIHEWERPQRTSQRCNLTVEHIMASAALPLVFPAVGIDGVYYGDGGVRLTAPLAPALHLGAQRVLAISTRYGRSAEDAGELMFEGPPSPAQVIGVLFNAIFLDLMDQDALQLERINRLLHSMPPAEREGLREVKLLVLRPSSDLAKLANEMEPRLPPMFRYLTRRLGTRQSKSQDFLSTVMFHNDYVHRLIEVGEADGDARADEIAAFLSH
ncbi:MAG: NTE family protein [Chlamydiales bacterium]|jgi:NTE family protein